MLQFGETDGRTDERRLSVGPLQQQELGSDTHMMSNSTTSGARLNLLIYVNYFLFSASVFSLDDDGRLCVSVGLNE